MRFLALLVAANLQVACGGAQSALDPQGPVAAQIATLWWVLLSICSAIFVLVSVLLLYAAYSRPEKRPRLPHGLFMLGGGLLFPVAVVLGLLIYGTEIGRRIVADGGGPVLHIEVTAHQWWWEVHYPADGEHAAFTTANEIHLPVGVRAEISLSSSDVIHSFWVPNLAGKLDAIPGLVNTLRLEAQRAGEFRGQCAEFCGVQHARMAFGVVAQTEQEFIAWRQARSRDAPAAGQLEDTARSGLDSFLALECHACHRIGGAIPGSGAGDPDTGVRGPDLTHVAARATIGARTLPYSRDNVARWIRDHQRLKPGNRMKDFSHVPDDTVEAIADYLDTLL